MKNPIDDPNMHWDGTQWHYWDGIRWIATGVLVEHSDAHATSDDKHGHSDLAGGATTTTSSQANAPPTAPAAAKPVPDADPLIEIAKSLANFKSKVTARQTALKQPLAIAEETLAVRRIARIGIMNRVTLFPTVVQTRNGQFPLDESCRAQVFVDGAATVVQGNWVKSYQDRRAMEIVLSGPGWEQTVRYTKDNRSSKQTNLEPADLRYFARAFENAGANVGSYRATHLAAVRSATDAINRTDGPGLETFGGELRVLRRFLKDTESKKLSRRARKLRKAILSEMKRLDTINDRLSKVRRRCTQLERAATG